MTVLAENPVLQGHATRLPSSAGVEALLAAANREVLVMSTLAVAARDPIGGVRRIDHENLRRGVRYRVIVPDTARTAPVLATRLGTLALSGADTRTVPDVPTDALVIDGSVVVLPVDRTAGAAVPMSPGGLPDAAELSAREKELLALLSSGSTDESAAARLGVSVRTVRRMVADIMNRLGARSRFQAGVKAADRGWLIERAG
jgi:DNA-binding CsgD family transcriptional regulator